MMADSVKSNLLATKLASISPENFRYLIAEQSLFYCFRARPTASLFQPLANHLG
ncbi:hypothetical protein SAMN05192566_2460 [Methylophilus rhizosphaerae]|uniref:Uncharacterized protein n=1 Tax=Methylophilus rhizosphaerae TaxID=492660 RepID=A0A1G9EU83_9PROT|nr:hypothetical protein SAMN05192566_2460 [Methylophilus rhizosphaerae]